MNLTVTTTTNAIKVNFNDTPLGIVSKGIWRKDMVTNILLETEHIHVMTTAGAFQVSHISTTDSFVIDSVDGAAPSSLSDLFDKLSAMLG